MVGENRAIFASKGDKVDSDVCRGVILLVILWAYLNFLVSLIIKADILCPSS